MNIALPKQRMNVDEFLAWAETQPDAHFELVDGKVIPMAPEKARHNLVKLAVAKALDDAVKAAKLPCVVFTDGMTVVINDHKTREPDASVQCGVEVDLDSTIIESPMIVVEVSSPSSERQDLNTKLVDYFSVPTISHYLVVLLEDQVVLHHQRSIGGDILTRIVREGEVALTPPGMTLPFAALLGVADPSGAAPGQTSLS